jgi:hypothetical protein
MAAIYAHSVITIAAASGINPEAGLFTHTVEPDMDMERPLDITNTLPNGNSSTIVLRHSISNTMNTNHSNLQRRAWTLQERVMSPRILHFFDVGILFECRQHFKI